MPPMALRTFFFFCPYRSPPRFSFHSNSHSHFSSSSFLPFHTKSNKTLLVRNSTPISPLHFDSDQSGIEDDKNEEIDCVVDSDSESESESEQINFFEGSVEGPSSFSDASHESIDEAQSEFEMMISDPEEQLGECTSTVHQILEIARNLSENSSFSDQLGNFQRIISEMDCVNLLKIMSQEGLVNECLDFFEWMRAKEPALVSVKSYTVLFSALGRSHMSEEIMDLVRNLPSERKFRDVSVYNSAILGLACCQRYDYAWEAYDLLESMNIQPDQITCSILITILRKTRGKTAKDAWELFQKITRKGVKWSLDSVSTLIKCFCDEGLKKEALLIQSEMEKKGISSNNSVYNILMNAYVKSDQIEEAEGLFKEMLERGVNPSVESFNILIGSYSKRIQPEICETLILEMCDFGLDPNVETYTSLIRAYARQKKNSEKANDVFIRMKNAGIKPNTNAYTALIHAYSIDGWYYKAFDMYQTMIKEEIKPCLETYSTLLDGFRRAQDTEKVMEIWKCMNENKVEGTRVTYNIILDCLAKQGIYLQAREVILEFGKLGLGPTTMTYNMLINAYAKGGQHYKIPNLLREMSCLELKPDPITYLTIINAYIRGRDFTKAFYFHKEMVRKRLKPDSTAYERLKNKLKKNAKTKNKRDRSAILGIVTSKFGMNKGGNKNEFWKGKKKMLTGRSRGKYV